MGRYDGLPSGRGRLSASELLLKDWAENFMMKFGVHDIDAWHAHTKKAIDEGDFAHARYDTPEIVGGDTKVFHVWDPCGVLLIFIQ